MRAVDFLCAGAWVAFIALAIIGAMGTMAAVLGGSSDYRIVAPYEVRDAYAPDGAAPSPIYRYDAAEWEVVATVDDRLVLRRRKDR